MDNVNKLMKGEMVEGIEGMDSVIDNESEGCSMGKHHQAKYPCGVVKRATEPLELVHSDVCGRQLIPLAALDNLSHFFDDYTRKRMFTLSSIKMKCWRNLKNLLTCRINCNIASGSTKYTLDHIISLLENENDPDITEISGGGSSDSDGSILPKKCSAEIIGQSEEPCFRESPNEHFNNM
ncbi:Hypothetical predicted protein, partial [Paramuricea clavata]